MDSEILQLASDANEAVIAFREECEVRESSLSYNPSKLLGLAGAMMRATDKLTGAIVEAANQ